LKVNVSTNGFWGSTEKKAKDEVTLIKKYGDTTAIVVSTDIFHEEFIPFENVINILKTGRKQGVKVAVRTLYIGYAGGRRTSALKEFKKRLKRYGISEVVLEAYPLIMRDDLRDITDSMGIKIDYVSRAPEKNSCSAIKTIFIDVEGGVYFCCSNMLQLSETDNVIIGNIFKESLKSIMEKASENFLINLLSSYGPQELLHIIKTVCGTDYGLAESIQRNDCCHLCHRIFSLAELTPTLKSMKNGRNSWA